MEKLLSRLGIYDLVGVWLTGATILFLFLHTSEVIFKESVIELSLMSNLAVLIVGAYFIGVVFQEIGNFIHRKCLNHNRKWLREIFKNSDGKLSSVNSLSLKETKAVKNHFYKQGLNIDENIDDIYNICKNRVDSQNTSVADNNQAISAFSRSLSLYFIASLLVFSIWFFFEHESMICYRMLIMVIISIPLAYLFHYRSKRFIKIRYVKYIRKFYFLEIEGKNKTVLKCKNKCKLKIKTSKR